MRLAKVKQFISKHISQIYQRKIRPALLLPTTNGLLSRLKAAYFKLQVNQRLYLNAIVLLGIFFLYSSVLGLTNSYTKGPLFLFLAFWIAAICYDLIGLYKKVYESVLGKAFLILLLSLCTKIAMTLSSQLVNDITSNDPSKFPHTIAIFSILCIPFFVAAAFSILYALLMVASPLLLMFHSLPDEKMKEVVIPGYSTKPSIPYQKTTRIIQFISFTFFCGFVFSSSQKVMKSYETFLTDTARSFIYTMEMYPKAPCVLEPGSKVAFLSDDKILVGTKNSTGITFKRSECKDDESTSEPKIDKPLKPK
jgi:hypothetical protein